MAFGSNLTSTEALTALIGAGGDAMTNLFLVEFSGGVFTDSNLTKEKVTKVSIRTSTITLPTLSIAKNTKSFQTIKYDLPAPKIVGDKSFTVSFRLDSNYEIYTTLLNIQADYFNGSLGYATTDLNKDKLFTTEVKVPSSSITSVEKEAYISNDTEKAPKNFKTLYKMENCWISDITQPKFSYDNANAITIDATIKFAKFIDNEYFTEKTQTGK